MLNIQKDIVLAPYTTFKIGGPAKYFSEAESVDEVQELLNWANEQKVPVFVLGGGSNVLIADKGFDGLVIKIKNSNLEIQDSIIECDAGVPLAKLVLESTKAGLSGLEWAIGIPGTVGGAINGNAGAYGKSMFETIKTVKVIETDKPPFQIIELTKDECGFKYRNSIFKNNKNFIIISAELHLKKGNGIEIQKMIKDYASQRAGSNPFGPPAGGSAGCFFVNPGWEGLRNKEELIREFPELAQFADKPKISAGFLIEQCSLKGKKIGSAAVSDKHANFIMNNGNATAQDILNLTNLIKEKIRKNYGIDLKSEVVVVE